MVTKVTVITSTLNSEDTLEETIKSVKQQTYLNIEHIIIDGGSTDKTIDIVKRHGLKYISAKDISIYQAFNRGLDLTESGIVHFLNSDDQYYDAQVIDNVMSEFYKDENIDAVFGLTLLYGKGNSKLIGSIKNNKKIKFQLTYKMPIAHPSTFFKKHVYYNYGSFSESYKIAGDFDFISRVIDRINYKFVNEPLVRMYDSGISMTKRKDSLLEQFSVSVLHSKKIFLPFAYYLVSILAFKLK